MSALIIGGVVCTALAVAGGFITDLKVGYWLGSTLLPLVAPVLVSMLLPVTVAGWGVRETAAATLWGAVGLASADGVAISVAYGLLVLLSSLPGALVLLAGRRLNRRRRRPGRRGRRIPAGRGGSGAGAPGPASPPSGA